METDHLILIAVIALALALCARRGFHCFVNVVVFLSKVCDVDYLFVAYHLAYRVFTTKRQYPQASACLDERWSQRWIFPNVAPQMRTAFSSMAWNTCSK